MPAPLPEAFLKIHILASGSKGNATIVENTLTGDGFLIDCGICKRDFFARCADVGFDPARLRAILITHVHTDHIKGLDVVLRGLARKDIRPALYMGESLCQAGIGRIDACAADMTDIIRAEKDLRIADIHINAFATSHDCVESFGFRCAHPCGHTLGYVTDTGIVDDAMLEYLKGCSVLALESNHDAALLSQCAYPYAVKNRIRSDRGHLSNEQAACVLAKLLHGNLEHVVAMHVSENSNTYRLAASSLQETIDNHRQGAQVHAAFQGRCRSV